MIQKCKDALKVLVHDDFDAVQDGNKVTLTNTVYTPAKVVDTATVTKDKNAYILDADFFFPADLAPYYKAFCILFGNEQKEMYRVKRVKNTKKEKVDIFIDTDHEYRMTYGMKHSGIILEVIK